MANRVFYDDGFIEITTTRAVIGSKTYAINGITSTEVVEIAPDRTAAILLLLLGLAMSSCCGVAFLGSLGGDPAGAVVPFLFVAFGAALAGLGVLLMVTQKPRYAVLICTSARQVQAYVTRNGNKADDIANAIDRAISARG